MHEEVLEKGILPTSEDGQPVDPAEQVVVKDKPKVVLPPDDGDERNAAILTAIEAVVEANDSAMFTGGGVPKSDAISQLLGWRVDSKDIRAVWEKHREKLLAEKEKKE